MCAGALKEGRSLTDQPLSLPPTFRDDVAQAMKAWRGDASQDSPLDYLFLVQIALVEGSQSLRHATNQVLLRALETLAESYDREAEVLRLYAAGLPLRVVAEHLHIAEDTAKEYLGRVRLKYAEAGRPAPTKTDLYRRAFEDGHLDPQSDG